MGRAKKVNSKGENRPETRGLYQRNGTWWFQPPMKDGRRPKPFSLGVDDLAKAIIARRDVLVNGREFIEERTPSSLDVLVKEYLAAKRKSGDFRNKTAANVESSLGLLVRYFAHVASPASVTAKMAQEYHDHWISEGKSEATARTYAVQAAAFFSWLHHPKKRIRTNPFAKVKTRQSNKSVRRHFVERNVRDALCRGQSVTDILAGKKRPGKAPLRDDLRFCLYAGFHAGLRRNEIIHARPSWFDLPRKLIHVQELSAAAAKKLDLDPFQLKDRENRVVPISEEFAKFLKTYLAGLSTRDDYCIGIGVRTGRSDYRYDFRKPFVDYMTAQGIADVTIHTMRHTFASLLASSGKVSLFEVARFLGDDPVTTEKHYTHLKPDLGRFQEAIV